jgi:ankyrin repeat protein
VDDASNEKGMTPLNLAAKVSSLNIAKMLVSSGASVMKNRCSWQQYTSLCSCE